MEDMDGKLYLESTEHARFFAHFKSLYINRVQHVGSQKKYSKDYVDIASRDAHKPNISEKSQQLAMKKRQKMLGNKNVTLVEVLLHQTETQDYLEQVRKEKEQKVNEECTFKPKTLTYHSGAQATHGDKCLDLYSRTQKGQYKEKIGKSQTDYEYEKAQQECTFVPKINQGVPSYEDVGSAQ